MSSGEGTSLHAVPHGKAKVVDALHCPRASSASQRLGDAAFKCMLVIVMNSSLLRLRDMLPSSGKKPIHCQADCNMQARGGAFSWALT